jgi:branched-chain amino acid transport system permease protein
VSFSDSLRGTWEHRRDLGALWWRFLTKLGLSKDRFHAWKPWQQRAGKVALAGVLAFLLSMFVNTLEHFFGSTKGSILTFDLSAYVVFAVIALIVIPEWGALPDVELRVIVPVAAVAAVAAAAIVGFATDSTRNAVIAGVGTFIALCAPPWLSRRGTERTPIQERKMPVGRKVVPLVVIALAITYPFYVGKLFTIPVFGPAPSVDTGVNMIVFMMMAVGLNIVVGYAGLLDLGYVAFYAIGAYTAAWFASLQFPTITFHFGAVGIDKNLPGIHITIWVLLVLAAVLTAMIGVLIGLPTLRLRGDYLAIVTLGFGEIMPQIARNGNDLFNTGFNLTGGPQGITPIDSPGFGNKLDKATHGFLPADFLTTGSANVFFWVALLLLGFTIFCSLRLRDSRLGRAWIAIREDEIAASAMGIPLMRTKTWSYAMGAFFGGLAGAYYASYKSSTFPQDFYFNISVFILCMVILGGMGNVWGVLLGAAFLEYLNVEGLANIGAWLNENLGTHIDVPGYQIGIYGVLIVVIMLLRPQGLLPSARRKRELEYGTHDEYLYDVESHDSPVYVENPEPA